MNPGGRIDRYVLRVFVKAYLACSLALLGLFSVMDLAMNVDEYVECTYHGEESYAMLLSAYYLLNVPFFYIQAGPFITLGAAVYTVVRLVQTNEWMAVLNAGVSSRRILAPVMGAALFLAAVSVGIDLVLGDGAGTRREALYRTLVGDPDTIENIWVRDAQGQPFFVRSFREDQVTGAAHIEGLEADILREGRWMEFAASEATYVQDASGGRWLLEGARLEYDDGDERYQLTPDELPLLDFEPEDVLVAARALGDPQGVSVEEVLELARRDPDNLRLRTIVQSRWAFPFSNVLFLLIALPFVVNMERRSALRGILIAVLFCFVYFVSDLLCRSLGMEGELSPSLAAWLPPVFFGSLGAVLFGHLRS